MTPEFRCRRAIRASFVGASLMATAAVSRGSSVPDQTKDHYLFVGADVAISLNGDYRPVVGAGNRSFIVNANGRSREVHRSQALAVRVSRGVKLSTLCASITQVDANTTSDRAAAEQMENLHSAMALTAMAEDQKDFLQVQSWREEWQAQLANLPDDPRAPDYPERNAEFKMQRVQEARSVFTPLMIEGQVTVDRVTNIAHDRALAGLATAPNQGDGIELLPEASPRGARLNVAASSTNATVRPVGSTGMPPAGIETPPTESEAPPAPAATQPLVHDRGEGRSDRFTLQFNVASHQPIANAFVILNTEYTAPGHQELFRRVLAQRIGRIGAQPRTVTVYEADFPTGFHVKDYTISLYSEGQEIATNLSPKRIDLTSAQAYQYVLADYLATHKGETSPPAAVLMAPRSVLLSFDHEEELSRPVYVLVNAEGHVQTVSSDPSGQGEVSSIVRSALQYFQFIPALQQGVPVSGRARLVVADFTR